VSEPRGILAYNWEVSPSSTMSPVILLNSTSGQTQDTVSGLANGTYFWHVQAVNGAFVQGAWSATQSFVVTGANASSPGSATLNAAKGGTQFHPMESITFTWSAVAGAASYSFDAATDPNFPVASKVHFDNIPNTTEVLTLGDSEPQGTWYVRVQAVNASGIAGPPSNTVTFVLSFNAPLPPPPTLLSPPNGATASLPVTFKWTDVPNPQLSGYTLEVASDSGFKNIVFLNNQITGPSYTVTSLPAGTNFWRVNSTQGDSAPGVPAVTAWSATGSFVVSSTRA
jgi:predicted phage tail protein